MRIKKIIALLKSSKCIKYCSYIILETIKMSMVSIFINVNGQIWLYFENSIFNHEKEYH